MSWRSPLRTVVLVVIAISLWTPEAAASLTIARGGKAAATVVVAESASKTEGQAASELAFFLHIVTGCDFPVVHGAPRPAARL